MGHQRTFKNRFCVNILREILKQHFKLNAFLQNFMLLSSLLYFKIRLKMPAPLLLFRLFQTYLEKI